MAEYDYDYLAALVLRAQDGDSDAFAELYAATYAKEYRFAYRYIKDEYLAQDAVQEAYINALKNIRKLKDPTLFISWLNQIVFRTCYGVAKAQSPYSSAVSIDEISDTLPERSDTPEQRVVTNDNEAYLRRHIDKLPDNESRAFLLRTERNMKIDDIADTMQISKSTVKRLLAKAKSHLRQSISQ